MNSCPGAHAGSGTSCSAGWSVTRGDLAKAEAIAYTGRVARDPHAHLWVKRGPLTHRIRPPGRDTLRVRKGLFRPAGTAEVLPLTDKCRSGHTSTSQ